MSLADQLSDVVLVVNGLVEELERAEESAEHDFFRSERLAIEIEFESRLADIRAHIVNHTHKQTDGEHSAKHKQTTTANTHKARRTHEQTQPQAQAQPPTPIAVAAPSHSTPPTVSAAHASPAPVPRVAQQRPAAHAPAPVPAVLPTAAAPAPAPAAVSVPSPSPLNVAAAVAASSSVAPLGSVHASAPSAASSATPPPSTLIVEFGAEAVPMRLSLEALSAAFPGLDAHAHRDGVLSVPSVELRTAKMILSAGANRRTQRAAAQSRAENERVRASQGNGFRVVLSEENRTEELIPESSLPSVVDACNALRIPWLFCLCASRLFAARPGSDLAWLHNLVATSVLNSLPVRDLLVLQEELLHVNALAIHAAMSIEMRDAARSGGVSSPDALKAVINMAWFLRVSREFANSYKTHLKRRTALIAAANKDSSQQQQQQPDAADAAGLDYSWLESAPPAAAAAAASSSAEGSPAVTVAAGASKPRPAAPSIVWVRLYFELLFAQQLLQLGGLSASSAAPAAGSGGAGGGGAAMKAAAEEALALWRSAGSLPLVLSVDLGLLCASGSGSGSAAALCVALHFLQLQLKELPRLLAFRLANVSLLDAAAFVRMLATAGPRLRIVLLQQVTPFLSRQALDTLQLEQYFPHIRVSIEA